ncbi:uncharacterized protein LAESUDRAFT_692678 [Laetiporus sulphureus 93-53]|uniref:Enterotoxin n=1 Tax=Laetiporus sulphureus 93-53 TaxID=1314785 RepID=A0A165HEE4_9APHY|nr:uncharacterized protein LAESUDRAFT_692678 [Laetiporus sulphureus 93-53]KZT11628.1 hypothetical protein LAESUDRAFT_692678 [Laetiporus sulphureus 93-53]
MLFLFFLTYVPAVAALLAQRPLSAAHPVSETALHEAFDNSNAPFIFSSLSGLLKQWPNTYHPNGQTIIPGILEPYTVLYHARKDNQIPPTSEWFAFDPEMSYGIMAGFGHTFLLTYRTIRPAKVVYFDGMSASLGNSGWLDSQEILIRGKGKSGDDDPTNYPVWGEQRRLEELCRWGEKFDIEGFIRMNSAFEIMWCNFHSPSIQLVSRLNITAPGTPYFNESDWPRRPPRGGLDATDGYSSSLDDLPMENESPEDGPDRGRQRRPGGDGPRRGPFGGAMSPFATTTFAEWLRAASWRAFAPQPHVRLDYGSFVTFYHPRLHSLASARAGQPMRKHRAWLNLSDEDAQSVVREVEEVVQRPMWMRSGSGMDWSALATNIVEEWTGRMVQLREFLGNASRSLNESAYINTTETLWEVRRLVYTPLNPYLDTTVAQNSSAWTWSDLDVSLSSQFPPRPPHQSPPPPNPFPPRLPLPDSHHPPAHPPSPPPSFLNTSALRRCTYSATGILHSAHIHLTPQEDLLRVSVETVLERLCTDYGTIFVESMHADDHAGLDDVKDMVIKWETRMLELMQWLDWTEWLKCDEVCSSDEVCTMPVWPLNFMRRGPRRGPGDPDEDEDDPVYYKPKCESVRSMWRFGPPGHLVETLLEARDLD